MSKNINFMISHNELNKLLKSTKDVVVIDVRAKEEYSKGHIYNAINIPEIATYLPEGITTDKEKKDFVSFFQNIFSNAGVSKNELVIFYEDRFTLKSPRGLTILKYLGYDENNIKVLDGGYYNWCKANFKTNTIDTKNMQKNFIPNVDENFFVDYNDMLKIIYDENIITLDVRDKDEWIGISSSPYGIDFAPKKGRLPNALWIEWYEFITNDMLSVESLEKITFELHKNNIHINDNIVLYCFKGARLSNSYIALRKLGYENIRIYFAGWNEWCRKDGAPIINEVENTDNPILQENIALKKRLDDINLQEASLIDFPKYTKEPVFAFDRDGNSCFENEPKKKNLPSIKKFIDIFPDADTTQIYNIIDNKEERTITINLNDKYYLLNCIGSRDVNRILVYAFDVTELKKVENELRTSKQYLEAIFKNEPECVKVIDSRGVLIDMNPAGLEMLQAQTLEEAQKHTLASYILPEWRAAFIALHRDVIQNGNSGSLEFEIKGLNGRHLWLETHAVPMQDKKNNITSLLAITRDVTQRKKSEYELKKLQIAIDQSPISIVITDVLGNLVYVNLQFLKVSGYTQEEVIGENPKVLSSGYTSDAEYAELWDTIYNKKTTWSGVFKNIKHNGEEYWESAIISPIVDDNNIIINYIGIKQDISDNIALENLLIEQDKLMIAQSRHAAMGEMISMIAHQWRQPLSSISATSASIQLELDLELYNLESKEGIDKARKQIKGELHNIDSYVQNLSTTIDDFRNFYKENKKSVRVKLEDIIEKSINIISSSLINDKIELIKEYNSNQKIEIYDSEMMQVILNLLKNSQDNFKEKKIKKPYIKITTKNKILTICDNGEGIAEDIIKRIFDPYFSTKNDKNGTGLGLYMSKTIIEEHHNGMLKVKNTEDGVCFIAELGTIS